MLCHRSSSATRALLRTAKRRIQSAPNISSTDSSGCCRVEKFSKYSMCHNGESHLSSSSHGTDLELPKIDVQLQKPANAFGFITVQRHVMFLTV